MLYRYITFALIITLSIASCKRKPKKSIEELPTKVETFQENSYLKSQLDSHTIDIIRLFGSEIDSAVYLQELDTISSIMQRNKTEEETYHTPTGVVYTIHKYGGGEYPEKGDIIQVQVETTTLDGKNIFSTSALKQPLQFVLGVGQVVPAWDEIFPNVQEGTQFQIIAPSALSYGQKGFLKAVPANTILKYEIKFDKIVTPKASSTKGASNLKMKEQKEADHKDEKYKIPATLKKPEKL